jgi:23S rRNA pseudouridine1911/1915/1917 synthase
MIVAKNDAAHQHLSRQFKSRQVKKEYVALVHGILKTATGSIKLPVGRHPVDRKRMTTVSAKGRTAETVWRIKEKFQSFTLLSLNLKTGRTHQIRVHCAALHHPIVGDKVYGPRKPEKTVARTHKQADKLLRLVKSVDRQMLHARRLSFTHPHSAKAVSFESPLPADMTRLIDSIKKLKI